MPTLVTPKEKIFAQLNLQRVQQSLVELNPADFDMDLPQDYTGTQVNRNTKCLAFPKASSIYIGPTLVLYDRINLSEIVSLFVAKGTATNVNALLPELSNKIGLQFEAGYFENTTLPMTSSFVLRCTTAALLHKGEATVYFE